MLDDLALARHLADLADALTMPAFRSRSFTVETKPDMTPVTDADRAVEQAVRAELGRIRPEDGILGEEFGATAGTDAFAPDGTSGRRWIIDPIDGTRNFVRGVPVWATLIALCDEHGIAIGVVSAPALARRWWAARGHGAFTVGPDHDAPHRLQVSAVRDLGDASLSISDHIGWPDGAIARLASATWRFRAYGDFWSHLLVAEGAVDIAAEPDLHSWDIAALVPIVTEAGGRITSYAGVEYDPSASTTSALSTNGLLHDAAMRMIQG